MGSLYYWVDSMIIGLSNYKEHISALPECIVKEM